MTKYSVVLNEVLCMRFVDLIWFQALFHSNFTKCLVSRVWQSRVYGVLVQRRKTKASSNSFLHSH